MTIKMIVFDVDGTLTDGSINISSNGELYKKFNVKDGYAIYNLNKYNVTPVIITGRTSKITEYRCEELKITELHQNVIDKKNKMVDIINKYNIAVENVAYIGDDVNDLECIKMVGFSACPCDSVKEIIKECDYVSSYPGGNGAVRDIIDHMISEGLI